MSLRIKTLEDYHDAYKASVDNPEKFWEEQAETFTWMKRWDKVLEWDFHMADTFWFIGGKLNITVNCLDRHLETKGDQTALIWEPNEPGSEGKKLTYQELYNEVCRFANALKNIGVHKGDRICFYMPMVPELMIGILACARIGAIHSVVFAGFSANSLADRIKDATCKVIVCTDQNSRGPKISPIKLIVDEALAMGCDSVEKVIVLSHTGGGISWNNHRDLWWHDIMDKQSTTCEPVMMDSEDPLFILYTSGSTGKPKGVVHTIGGYMVYVWYSFLNVFQYKDGDIYWCTADIGWITGHSYIVYGPLLSGATTVMFEGIPSYPDPSRFWQICEKYKVNIFYTAPTAIRSLMAAGDKYAQGHNLSSLHVLGTVGEPINAEAWHWYHEHIGKGKIPVVDTWWQTETGGILISPIAGITDMKPCYASYPMPGIQPILVDIYGNEIEGNDVEGLLCIKFPWPSIIRTTYGDHGRCREIYFNVFPELYFTGDGARRDEEGRYRIIGRVDDVINVSGHRIGTAEVENAINEHPLVVESAVVGYPHDIKGQGLYAFVISRENVHDLNTFQKEINEKLTILIGPIVKTDIILIVSGLPKTRSGKIMRRILRKIAEGDLSNLGDISTLFNPEIVDEIIAKSKSLV
ncbi:MAG: acetate--CoA ligase [Saprospiraceae bacterium]|uniref:Acetate--CoA ligase n=1 Tax=Candidatus Opimibacter skivensis TaxID=2982028 RepID=A0A9D7SSV9_9BACT|nr:acetate--CoA ligase [Candidatus Opimibacter skivensis]